jgi:outer membrane protein assembly factor BamB
MKISRARPSQSPFQPTWAALCLTALCRAAFACLACCACAPSPDTLELGVSAPGALASAAAFRQTIEGRSNAGPSSAQANANEPSALAVGASADELIGARLDRPPKEARQWRIALTVSSPPVLAPGVVVFASGKELVALAPESGQRLWAVPARGAGLLAATADGEHTALLLGDGRGRRWIGVYDRAARERLRVTAAGELGAPALLGGALLVPSGDGYVSAVDVGAGTELARIRPASAPVNALWMHGTLFFGGPPWLQLGREAPAYALPRRPLPEPVRSTLASLSMPSAGARPEDATRLYVDPTHADGEPALYMATYGRIALGLEREHGTLAWVLALPGRVLAAAAVSGGFAVCDDSGSVRLISAHSGRIERQWQLLRERRITLGEPTLSACAISSGGVLGPDPEGAESAPPEPLLDQLARVLGLSDPALTDAQRFLSRELAARPEPEATRVLIDLVTRHSLDRVLQSEAEDLLATRRNGQDHMLTALSEAGGQGERALPPIAPLGEALAALGERRAAPLLARQLNRPAHSASAVARAAAALEALASEAEYGELTVFFSLHRTNADGPEWVAAVASVARTLLRVGGQRARTLLQFATRDPLTVPEVKAALEAALGAPTALTTGS